MSELALVLGIAVIVIANSALWWSWGYKDGKKEERRKHKVGYSSQ